MVEWRHIVGYDNYEVSNTGEVRNAKTGRILKPSCSRGGYLKVNLRNQGVAKSSKIHRLVAETFVYNEHDKPLVNHIDGNKSNNRSDNLEWCNSSENNKHAFDNGLSYRPVNSGVPRRRTRIVETGQIFDSISECARFLNVPESNVGACLYGNGKSCRGYHFEYVE